MSSEAPARRPADWLLVAGALAISLILIWTITREPLVAGAYGAGVVALGALAYAIARGRPATREAEFALPDWSVTVAAIENSELAVAVIDRAGRLVCANSRYEDWFGAAHSPPRLPVDEASLERLGRVARSAWRGMFRCRRNCRPGPE